MKLFRENADGSAVCQHRNLSVCPSCVTKGGDLIVEVYGAHYICLSTEEANQLRSAIA